MPESVKDRCTKSHEYLFLLSKTKSIIMTMKQLKNQSSKTGEQGNRDAGKYHNPAH